MTSVIRVKRRIDVDPAEALCLSCKKRRKRFSAGGDDEVPGQVVEKEQLERELTFAGTIKSKSESVSQHIQNAIRKNKLHRELHPHATDLKTRSHKSEVTQSLRENVDSASRKNRYRITASKRAIDISELDGDRDSEETNKDTGDCSGLSDRLQGKEVAIAKSVNGKTKEISGAELESAVKEQALCQRTLRSSQPSDKENAMFCVFDAESENEEDRDMCQALKSSRSSGITVNGSPMVVKEAPLAESEYVYDLYYTQSVIDGMDTDAILTVHNLCAELVLDGDGRLQEDEDVVYDDEDDSNDEENWRNDYPDEDPHFFENEDADYDYSEDLVDRNVLDDGGDLLSYWMDKRCRVGVDSDNDSDEDYDKDRDSSDSDDLDF